MTMLGADIPELRNLAVQIDTAAVKIDSARTKVNARIRGTTWKGTDARDFTTKWSGDLSPALRSAAELLREAAKEARRNADEQERASDAGSVSGGPGGSCSWSNSESLDGDLEISDAESRGCWEAAQGNPEQAGRDVLARTLLDTHDGTKIAPDEFEVIQLDNGKYIVVLPGVTDLTAWKPWAAENATNWLPGKEFTDSPWGLDPGHRSVRDLDYGAISSAGGTSTADNPYAQFVKDQLELLGVPHGADISIVGHSYGADTAVDLAADPSFNGGPNGYNVTHVLAAGYYSKEDILDVPSSTNVLAIQNYRDAAVIGEGLGDSGRPVVQGGSIAVDGIRELNPFKVVVGGAVATHGLGEMAGDAAGVGKDVVGDMASGARLDDPLAGWGEAKHNAWTLDPGTTHTTNGQVNIVFEGGGAGAGHEPSNYADYVSNTDSPEVAAFSQSMAESGYAGSGEAWALDVSVPESAE